MKVQYIAVIFVIIILPIAMTMSYSIGARIDTINLQTKYNAKLIDSTYDAMMAFQINTANNRYSSVANSKIRDIEAAASAFYKSLSNNQDITTKDLSMYVPALVFTLYDGYYIYSKYDNVYGGDDFILGRPQIDDVELRNSEYENEGLKPYIYYSCRFKNGTKDFVVNFTLDNAITIYGNIGEGYHTYSGYLINPDNVKIPSSFDESKPLTWTLEYSTGKPGDTVTISPELLTEHVLFADGEQGDYDYLVYNGQKFYYDKNKAGEETETETKYFYYNNYEKAYISQSLNVYEYLKNRTSSDGHLYSTSSFEYYKTAKEFSNTICNYLYDITQKHIVDQEGNEVPGDYFPVNLGNAHIFNVKESDNNPLLESSAFNEIRIQVIRKTIETNLTTAIAQYSKFIGEEYEFRLPVMSDVDWEKITNQVSVISFMQGLPIGYKYFNDYCVITNDNNEEVVKKENIYIITRNSSGQREYHLPGCTELLKPETGTGGTGLDIIDVAYNNLNFIRQTVRISEGNYIYFYPQTRMLPNETVEPITACYHCIVDAGSVYSADEIIKGELIGQKEDFSGEEVKADVSNSSSREGQRLQQIRQYYLSALGRERYDLYRFNIDTFNQN